MGSPVWQTSSFTRVGGVKMNNDATRKEAIRKMLERIRIREARKQKALHYRQLLLNLEDTPSVIGGV